MIGRAHFCFCLIVFLSKTEIYRVPQEKVMKRFFLIAAPFCTAELERTHVLTYDKESIHSFGNI